jgi:hypothetical protein
VPVVRARVEEAIDLGERTLRRRHNGRVVEVRAEVEMQLEVGEPARVEELRVRLRVLHQRDNARRIGGGPDDGGREELEAHRLGDLLRAQHRAAGMVTLATGTRASWSQTSAVAACAPWSR